MCNMMNLLGFCLFLPISAAAQGLFEEAVTGTAVTGTEETGTEAPKVLSVNVGPTTFELNGYVRGDLFVGKAPDKDASQVKAGYGEAALKVRARAGSWGDAYGELRFKTGMQWAERVTELQLREAYINLYLGPFDLRFGHQIIVWGRADGFNPTDNLTPRDMNVRSANEDDRRLGNLALRAFFNAQPLRVEGVWVPFFAESRFPSFGLPDPLSMAAPNYPDQNLSKGIGAVRLHLETAALEASLSYLNGHATFPGLRLVDFTLALPPDAIVVVGFAAHRHQIVGADFSTTIGDFLGLRGEVAYRRPFDKHRDDVPLRDLQYVLGVDREIITDVSIIAQYVGRYIFDFEELPPSKPDAGPDDVLRFPGGVRAFITNEVLHMMRAIYGQTEQVSHAASLRVQWMTLHETLSLEVMGYYNFTTEDYLIRPKITYSITDALEVMAGGEIYGGNEDTLFGLVEETLSAGFVEARASF